MSTSDSGDNPEQMVTVHIVALPVDIHVQAQQHGDEVTRELMLVAEQLHQQGNSGGLPARFIELVSTLNTRYSIFTAEQELQLANAIESGHPTVDLSYTLPASVAEAAGHLGEILDEVDQYCREGKLLLTLETPPSLVTYRRWFLDQFVDQATGKPPVAWSDYQPAATG